jgi:hypothetical protein
MVSSRCTEANKSALERLKNPLRSIFICLEYKIASIAVFIKIENCSVSSNNIIIGIHILMKRVTPWLIFEVRRINERNPFYDLTEKELNLEILKIIHHDS